MPIFKYTLKKYLKSVSTWVIVGISMFLVIVLGGFLPFSLMKTDKPDSAMNYGIISIALVAGITSFLSIFTSVFAGFKSATMYKDEVEDGTFLVMLSKPITRSKIIFFKWLALQTMIALYTLIVALSFMLAIVAFDKGSKIPELSKMGIETLRSKSLMIGLSLWGILFVVALIFSSIALLLSTRLTVGTTIGISIALGVIIPITSLVGTFTMKPQYAAVGTSNAATVQAIAEKMHVSEDEAKALTDPTKTLYQLGVSTGEKDTFIFAQAFDLNYQIQTLSEFASDQAIPEKAKDLLANANTHQTQMKPVKHELLGNGVFPSSRDEQIKALNDLITNSWKATQAIREQLLDAISAVALIAHFDTKPLKITGFAEANKPELTISLGAEAAAAIEAAKAKVDASITPEQFRDNISIAQKIMEALYSDEDLLRDPTTHASHLNSEIKSMLDYGIKILEPLRFWISSANLERALADVSTDSSALDNAKTLGNLYQVISKDQAGEYKMLISAINNGYNLVKIKTVDYANKWTLLWVYLAIALALVPVSYLVVRKQDFR